MEPGAREPCLLRLQLPRESCLLGLKLAGIAGLLGLLESLLLRLLEPLLGKSCWLGLLKPRTLTGEASRLRSQRLELLWLLLLLLGVKPRLHRILVALSPLRHVGQSSSPS